MSSREAAELAIGDLIAVLRTVVGLARPLEAICLGSGISFAQYRLLVALERDGGRAGEIATRIGVNRSTLSALAAGLERAGLVTRDDVAADLRGVRLELTPDGERALEGAELRRLFVRAFLRLAAETKAIAPWPETEPAAPRGQ